MRKFVSGPILSIPLLLLGGAQALADDVPNPNDIYLGTPAVGGSGCPQGTTSAALAPDGKTLSILFDQFQVEAGRTTGRRLDRKTCDLGIPVHVPQGFSVSVMKVDYRGFNALPQGAHSLFNVDYFFAGTHGPGFSRAFYGPLNQDYLISNPVVGQSVVWSACGADVNLRINASMQVQSNPAFEQAMATVDSTDIKASLIYQLQWKRCGGNPVPQPLPQPVDPQPVGPQPGDEGYYNGNCRIDSDPYHGGYMVHDINQNLVGRASSYPDAVALAQQADGDGRCLGQQAPDPQPYPPYNPAPQPAPYPPYNPFPQPAPYPGYNPFPQPAPYPGYNPYPQPQPVGPLPLPPFVPPYHPHFGGAVVTCQAQTPYGMFTASAPSEAEAASRARSACLAAVHNSRPCNAAQISCH